jgi:hypothetical protein
VVNFAQLSPNDGFIFLSVETKRVEEMPCRRKQHLTYAARHHREAAKHHEAGSHAKAVHHVTKVGCDVRIVPWGLTYGSSDLALQFFVQA